MLSDTIFVTLNNRRLWLNMHSPLNTQTYVNFHRPVDYANAVIIFFLKQLRTSVLKLTSYQCQYLQ